MYLYTRFLADFFLADFTPFCWFIFGCEYLFSPSTVYIYLFHASVYLLFFMLDISYSINSAAVVVVVASREGCARRLPGVEMRVPPARGGHSNLYAKFVY